MVTYLYWFLLAALVLGVFMGLGVRFGMWKAGFAAGLLLAAVGTIAYYFYFEQIFVKRYGGVMPIENAEGQLHLGVTWKDDNLWVESWDPKENVCYFREYARSNLLEGVVKISNCNPLYANGTVQRIHEPAPAATSPVSAP